jgi:hypothetical protein
MSQPHDAGRLPGGGTVWGGRNSRYQVSFDRSSAGAKAGSLSIASNDSDEPTVNVTLSGYGGWYVCLPLVLNSDWCQCS